MSDSVAGFFDTRRSGVRGERIDHEADRREQEELKAAENILREIDSEAYRMYKKIDKNDFADSHKEFKEETAKIIAEVEALEGNLYTREGKNNEIRDRVKQLADEYFKKGEETARVKQEMLDKLKGKLDDDLTKGFMNNNDAAEMEQLKNKVQTDIAFAIHQRDIEGIARELSEQAKRNRTVARFLVTHGHIFASAVDRLAKKHNPSDKPASLRQIKIYIDSARPYAYSKGESARKKIREVIDNRVVSTSSMLIKMHRDGILKRYS